jgi:hypothetical protein
MYVYSLVPFYLNSTSFIFSSRSIHNSFLFIIFFYYLIMQLLVLYRSTLSIFSHLSYKILSYCLTPYSSFFFLFLVFNPMFLIILFVSLSLYVLPILLDILLLLSDFSFLLYSLFPGVFFYLPSVLSSINFFIRCLLLSFFVAPAPEHLLISRFSLFSFFFYLLFNKI